LCARASTVDFQFSATLQTGALAGDQFTGTGSYDNQGETGVGTEFFYLVTLSFSVDGMTFDQTDIEEGGQAILVNGALDSFTADFVPETGPIDNVAFGFGGPGVIGYSTPPGFNFGLGAFTFTSATPEPPSLWWCGLATLAAGATFGRRRAICTNTT